MKKPFFLPHFWLFFFTDGQSSILDSLAKRLGADIVMGCNDKVAQLESWRKDKQLEWTQVAYIGMSKIQVIHASASAE